MRPRDILATPRDTVADTRSRHGADTSRHLATPLSRDPPYTPQGVGRGRERSLNAPLHAIIFLDIDGVLNTRRAAGWRRWRPTPVTPGKVRARAAIVRRPSRALDRDAIKRLDRLCAEACAVVVVTSTWRTDRDVPTILRALGFAGTFHNAWRTDSDGPTRVDEITR